MSKKETFVLTYPEVDVEIASTTKFSIAHLKGDRHLIIPMEVFVEAFPAMRLELDIMC